jgi:hypothetical protein
MDRKWAISAALVGVVAWFGYTWVCYPGGQQLQFLDLHHQQGADVADRADALRLYSTSLASSPTAAEQLALLVFDLVMSEKIVQREIAKAAKQACDLEMQVKKSANVAFAGAAISTMLGTAAGVDELQFALGLYYVQLKDKGSCESSAKMFVKASQLMRKLLGGEPLPRTLLRQAITIHPQLVASFKRLPDAEKIIGGLMTEINASDGPAAAGEVAVKLPTEGSPVVCVIGSGPLSEVQRIEIEQCPGEVVRFNDRKNKRAWEREDVHVERHHGRGWKLSEDQKSFGGWTACNIRRGEKINCEYHKTFGGREENGCALFRDCEEWGEVEGIQYIEDWPTTGTMYLSDAQKQKHIETIRVYGMNWNMIDKNAHRDSEGVLIKKCCKKCSIHDTPFKRYCPLGWHWDGGNTCIPATDADGALQKELSKSVRASSTAPARG